MEQPQEPLPLQHLIKYSLYQDVPLLQIIIIRTVRDRSDSIVDPNNSGSPCLKLL